MNFIDQQWTKEDMNFKFNVRVEQLKGTNLKNNIKINDILCDQNTCIKDIEVESKGIVVASPTNLLLEVEVNFNFTNDNKASMKYYFIVSMLLLDNERLEELNNDSIRKTLLKLYKKNYVLPEIDFMTFEIE